VDDLDRDRPLQPLVEAAIDLSHPAHPDERIDADAPNAIAGLERHGEIVAATHPLA